MSNQRGLTVGNQTEKILKVSKILNILLMIGGIVLILAMVLQIVLVIIAPSLDIEADANIIDVWGANMIMDGSLDNFRALMIVTMLSAGIMAAILFVASFVFKDIRREGTPFAKKNSNKIKVLSLLILAKAIIIPPLQCLAVIILTSMDDASTLFDFNLDLGYLVVAAVFFCLALIFEYGAELQRQADETL